MSDGTTGQETFLPCGVAKRVGCEHRAADAVFATSRKVILRKKSNKYGIQRLDSDFISSFELLDQAVTEGSFYPLTFFNEPVHFPKLVCT